ncbi:beta-ketoacyl synthase N-terminal-like domain-containing protein, partial [Mycobacterium angelicum]|uniref:beta-ketoacyl synthase N-terminal-like domain-containing protein n=1 Tax=Mycobacterium angelicum TaxID=470074 RepID=UPI00355777CF
MYLHQARGAARSWLMDDRADAERESFAKSAGVMGGDFVAIVGMACRFPGVGDLSGLWGLLRGGVEAVGV